MTRAVRPITILLAIAALSAAPTAGAGPAAVQAPTSTCWLDVINDWVVHQPNVVGAYAIPCYRQAIQHLNRYKDIKGYSSAPDDIQRALLAAIRDQHGGGGGGGRGRGGSNQGPGGSTETPRPGGSNHSPSLGGSNDNSSGGSKSGGGLGSIFGAHDATSIPLPLIVLGALAVLLALAALATWVARRLQERRVQPAPAVPRRR